MSNNLFGLFAFYLPTCYSNGIHWILNTTWLPFLLLVENTYVGNCLHTEQGLAIRGRKDVN